MDYDKEHITKLARRLYDGITSQVDEIVLNGPGDLEGPDRYIGNLNLSFAYVEGESLIMGLKVGPFSLPACVALLLHSYEHLPESGPPARALSLVCRCRL